MKTSLSSRTLIAVLLLAAGTLLQTHAATFVVTNAGDSGPGSLRDAIGQANANAQPDTIDFDPAFFGDARTIVLASELQITADGTNPGRAVTINGPGADRLTISGNNAVRPFFLAANSTVSMAGMTIRDGNAVGTVLNNEGKSGGAILGDRTFLRLTNVVIRNNSAEDYGGGMYLSAARDLSIANSLITENVADEGGGIYDFHSLVKSIVDTTISNNSVRNETGGAAFSRGKTTITNCRITGNRSGTLEGGTNGIGGLSLFQTNGTVTDTLISGNVAGDRTVPVGNGAGSYGGVYSDGGAVIFRRVTVTDNVARGNAGGMYLRLNQTVIDSLIANNRVENGGFQGGGIQTANASGPITIINTTIANNFTPGTGGGIANFTTGLNVINSTITGNTAQEDNPSNDTSDGGGGIFNGNSFGATTTVRNSIIARNTGPSGPDLTGGFVSEGYNIIGNTANSTGFGATGDQLNVDPLLATEGLQNNGGATQTIALQPNSPAIDKGKSVNINTDQRGVARPFDDPNVANAEGGDGSEIGAFEIGEALVMQEKTLGNIATRLPVQTGEDVMIGGFIITGDIPKPVLIRGIGPSLNVGGNAELQDPTLELYDGEGNLISSNDNWQDSQEEDIRRTGIPPTHPLEAAIQRGLNPGFYTAVLRGKDDTVGVALLEIYDLDVRPNSRLANISTRGFSGAASSVLIGGFIVGPNTRVVVRGIGPSLANAGVQTPLADPYLEVVNSNGEVVRANDNWRGIQQQELEALGIQPRDDREAALVMTLAAGNYTAVLKGAGDSTGIALVEVYNLQ